MANILLVEDQAIYREPICSVLEHDGHSVEAVADGCAAIATLAEWAPDLVLLDLKIPGLSGEEVLAALRRHAHLKNVPVIVLTAVTGRGSVIKTAKLGVSAYLSKTDFSLERMLDVVKCVLGASASGQRTFGGVDDKAEEIALKDVARPSPPPERHAPDWTTTADSAVALRSIPSVMSRKQTLALLDSLDDLKGFSPTVAQVLTLSADPKCTVDSIASAIALDQAMSLRVLRLANSSAFSPGTPVDSIRRAVVQIGVTRIHQIVLALGVVEQMSDPAHSTRLDMAQFWEHSIACAVISAEIARATEPSASDAAFAAGLLHDVGRLVLARQLGHQYDAAMAMARDLRLPLDQVEARAFSVTHADIMEDVLKVWNFSKELADPIVMHHAATGEQRASGPRLGYSTLRLILADRLAHAFLLGRSGNEIIHPTGELCHWLGINADSMRRIERRAQEQTEQMRKSMLSGSEEVAGARYADERRAQMPKGMRPVFVGEEPTFNAYRILCDQLSADSKDEPAGLVIVHIAAPDRIAHIAELLLSKERSERVHHLPLVILAPANTMCLNGQILEGRASCRLQIPVRVDQLLEAIREVTLRTRSEKSAA